MARILIVDDSPSQLMGMKRIVEKLGHEALSAEDGSAGVEAAKAVGDVHARALQKQAIEATAKTVKP